MTTGIDVLDPARVQAGERWIYSAGFNVGRALGSTDRIDEELDDLAGLADAGARVAILSHQGSHRDGSAQHLDHVAAYLGERLGRPVGYVRDAVSDAAVAAAHALRPGEVALFGNTRHHPGEEAGDPQLAERFARLGDRVAVGGFSKAHRAHASNVGILRRRPGCATRGLARAVEALAPWAHDEDDARPSVAVVGGLKREKLEVGLAAFAARGWIVIPGGAVLNAVLAARGHDIGSSTLGELGARLEVARAVLAGPDGATVHVPSEVLVAPAAGGPATPVRVEDGVPAGHRIVDFRLEPWAREALHGLARAGGRAVLAGTPTLYTEGHRGASDELLARFAAPGVEALLVGGDTVAELPWGGPRSTGGGSALHLLARGTCAVLEALAASRRPAALR